MNPEVVPLLVVAILLLTAGGDVGRADVVFQGDHEAGTEALVVAGGTTTVPANATTPGPVYVVNGTLDVQGTVDGGVTQLGGNVTVGSDARVGGEYQALGGRRSIAPGADVDVTTVDVTGGPSPGVGVALFLVQTVVLALAGFVLGRRRPDQLATVGDAARDHPVVSVTVGALVAVSAVALLVFMAFTLVLIPLSVLGLVAGVLVTLYGVVALGYLLGAELDRVGLDIEDTGLATALGVVGVSLAVELLGFVPLGDVAVLVVGTVGIGAVLVTYLGFRPFEPASIPE